MFPLDRIFRIRECEICKQPIIEDYEGIQGSTLDKLSFQNKMHTVVFIPPAGEGKSWHLCESCATAVSDAFNTVSKKAKRLVRD